MLRDLKPNAIETKIRKEHVALLTPKKGCGMFFLQELQKCQRLRIVVIALQFLEDSHLHFEDLLRLFRRFWATHSPVVNRRQRLQAAYPFFRPHFVGMSTFEALTVYVLNNETDSKRKL